MVAAVTKQVKVVRALAVAVRARMVEALVVAAVATARVVEEIEWEVAAMGRAEEMGNVEEGMAKVEWASPPWVGVAVAGEAREEVAVALAGTAEVSVVVAVVEGT